MGRLLRLLDTVFTDPTLARARADRILTDGSLFLIDPANKGGPGMWPAGIPANGALVPNLAEREARDALANPAAEVRGLITNGPGFTDGTHGRFERTPKGGVHGILSQTQVIAGGAGLHIAMPTALKTYLAANWDHALYSSLWWRGTRVSQATDASSLTGVPDRMGIAFTTSPAASYHHYVKATGRRPTAPLGAFPAGSNEAALDVLGNQRSSIARSGHNGTAPANAGEVYAGVGAWGKVGSNTSGIALANWASWVLYRYYVEDLTLSGRTYGDVDAIDAELYAKHVVTAGGRYAGDTIPTDPATIP